MFLHNIICMILKIYLAEPFLNEKVKNPIFCFSLFLLLSYYFLSVFTKRSFKGRLF